MEQLTNHIMMIRPANFGFNDETAANNAFQTFEVNQDREKLKHTAQEEFDNMVKILKSKEIQVTVIQDSNYPIKPDAIFPNNWVSFHENGAVITYPMFAPNRRTERDEKIIDTIGQSYKINNRYSFEFYENEDEPLFLEGTGSMIFDRPNRLVYACLSDRTDATLLDKFNVLMGTKSIVFRAVDKNGEDIYHTNVMMALGADFVVICMDSILDFQSKNELYHSFQSTGKDVIEISQKQVESFAGNMLEVKSKNGNRYLCLSQSAFDSLTSNQKSKLSAHTKLLPIPIPNIEKIGGGSVRCMMAEIFLPPR